MKERLQEFFYILFCMILGCLSLASSIEAISFLIQGMFWTNNFAVCVFFAVFSFLFLFLILCGKSFLEKPYSNN